MDIDGVQLSADYGWWLQHIVAIRIDKITGSERNAGNTKGRKECCAFLNMKAVCFSSSQPMQQQLAKRGELGM